MRNKNIAIILSATLAIVAFAGWPFSLVCGQSATHHLQNATYSVKYDNISHVPVQTDWVLHYYDFKTPRKRVAKYFKADSRLPKPRIKDADYAKSGYMRGHMCPAADRTTTKAMMKETFLMSNVAPQTAQLNCGRWEELESQTRQLARLHDSVKVQVRALFLRPESIYIGRGRIRVPSHFLRMVRCARTDSLLLWCIVGQNGELWLSTLVPK